MRPSPRTRHGPRASRTVALAVAVTLAACGGLSSDGGGSGDASDGGTTRDGSTADGRDAGGHAAPCAANEFLHDDPICGPPSPGDPIPCGQAGDLRCHRRCEVEADCAPLGLHCAQQGLFNGGDWNCNASVRICRADPTNDC